MRLRNRLVVFAFLALLGTSAHSQVKDMPSQAELDPILENADSKVKDFLATLTRYRVEASGIDRERLEKDLHDFRQLREMIQAAHSGTGGRGMNLERIFGVVVSLDDAAMEAAVWSNLLTARICGQPEQKLIYFALAVQDNGGMLREVSNELSHPAFRLMGAADEIVLAVADTTSKGKPKPR
jgi:hypothetical protein